jgi:transposase-like protein/IS1 family transposase
VILATCQHESVKKHGKDRKGNQRFRCRLCGETWTESRSKPLGDMRITMKEASTALGMPLEGMSVRAVARITGHDPGTICDLIVTVGDNCERFLREKIRAVAVKDVQLDEIWSFVAMKEKTRAALARGAEVGDSWTFIGIDRDTKLVLTYAIGQRDMATSMRFLKQLNAATSGQFQLSTDGLQSYTLNVPFVFGSRVDFAQLIKTFQSTQSTVRYSPAKISSVEKKPRFGSPDPEKICTSHVERFNLSVRMHCRRFTRLTNAHSKSPKHHAAMQAIFFAWYNWTRKHEALKGQTPAMAAGLAEKALSIRELLAVAAALPYVASELLATDIPSIQEKNPLNLSRA